MPTYEYECKSCGHTFEAFQSMSDAPLKNCPECGREVRRLILGGTGVIFKGSGFYVTDKGKGANAAAGVTAKSPKPAESASSGESASGAAKQTAPAGAASGSAADTGKAADTGHKAAKTA
jgi:putative FmdB family regulatory protein